VARHGQLDTSGNSVVFFQYSEILQAPLARGNRIALVTRRIDGRGLRRPSSAPQRGEVPGVAAMVQNIVAGLVVVALIVIAAISYAQEHQECWSGHIIKTLKPCGSVTPSI
jgi:hypothetical protein